MADVKSQLAELNKMGGEILKKGGSMADHVKFMYAPDCKMMVPGREKPIEGHDNKDIVYEIEKRIKAWGPDQDTEQEEVIDLGDMAVDRGNYYSRGADGSIKINGMYLQLWKKVDGQWKMYLDIFTT